MFNIQKSLRPGPYFPNIHTLGIAARIMAKIQMRWKLKIH
jgi:hypothetical protein